MERCYSQNDGPNLASGHAKDIAADERMYTKNVDPKYTFRRCAQVSSRAKAALCLSDSWLLRQTQSSATAPLEGGEVNDGPFLSASPGSTMSFAQRPVPVCPPGWGLDGPAIDGHLHDDLYRPDEGLSQADQRNRFRADTLLRDAGDVFC
jgi:hypothetical protein